MLSALQKANANHIPTSSPNTPASPPKCFVQDKNGEWRCVIRASGGEKVLIVGRPPDLTQLHVTVECEHSWHPITPSNLPQELQQGFSAALETLIKVAVFTVSQLSNGSYKLELEIGKGRSMRAAERLLLEQQLLAKLLPTIEQGLSIDMNHFALTPNGQLLAEWLPTGSFLVFAGIGCGAAAVIGAATGGITLIPVLLITAGMIAGMAICGGIACYLGDKQEFASEVKKLVNDAKECFGSAYLAYNEQNESVVTSTVNTFIKKTMDHKFVKHFSPRLFEFDEKGFKKMSTLYSKKDKEPVLAMMKLLILFSVQLLPLHLWPSAAALECFENVNMDVIPENLKE